jgi:hypothetical protein
MKRKKNYFMFLATILEPCTEIWRFLIKKSLNLQPKKFPKIWVADLDLLKMAPKPKGN